MHIFKHKLRLFLVTLNGLIVYGILQRIINSYSSEIENEDSKAMLSERGRLLLQTSSTPFKITTTMEITEVFNKPTKHNLLFSLFPEMLQTMPVSLQLQQALSEAANKVSIYKVKIRQCKS